MQKLSNETRDMLRSYEANLYTLETMLGSTMQQLAATLQEEELSYMKQTVNTMLANIRQQKAIIHRNLLW